METVQQLILGHGDASLSSLASPLSWSSPSGQHERILRTVRKEEVLMEGRPGRLGPAARRSGRCSCWPGSPGATLGRPGARALVAELLHRERAGRKPELRALAERVGAVA